MTVNGGGGISGATVSIGALSVATDSSGNFTFSNLANGTYTVDVAMAGYTFNPTSQSETISSGNITGVTFAAATINGMPAPPALPTITSYTENVPTTSSPVLVGANTLTEDFEPTVETAVDATTGAALPSGFGLAFASYPIQRIQLVNTSGVIVTSPYWLATPGSLVAQNVPLKPLSQLPVLELTEFWQLIGNVQRYAAGTNTSVTTSYTYGVNSSQSSSFTSTVGASATASVGVGPAKFSATVSTQFSSTTSSSLDISSSQSTSKTFEVNAPSNENVVYTLWQLVYELRIVLHDTSASGADQFGYVPFSDLNFTLLSSDVAPIYVYQQNQIVPETAFFTQ